MKIRYNAPVTLTFALASALVLIIDQALLPNLIEGLFAVPGKNGFSFSYLPNYVLLLTHIIGHSSWEHLMSNFSFILLLGPILEEKYSSGSVFIMVLITALVTGLLNVIFLNTGLMGASGIVFMMILLMSFTNIRKGEIPLTLILIILLFLSKEIVASFQADSISQLAHIVGGICGGLFGFLGSGNRNRG